MMSLDRRVRNGLDRSLSDLTADLDARLVTVERRARRATVRDRVAGAAIALVVGVSFVGLWSSVSRIDRGPAPATPNAGGLVNVFRTDLSGSGGSLRAAGVDGRWTIVFNGDGSVRWSAPPASDVVEGLPYDTYQTSGSTFVTDMFGREVCRGAGIGTYAWSRTSTSLTLRALDDDCAIRHAILTSEPWTAG